MENQMEKYLHKYYVSIRQAETLRTEILLQNWQYVVNSYKVTVKRPIKNWTCYYIFFTYFQYKTLHNISVIIDFE